MNKTRLSVDEFRSCCAQSRSGYQIFARCQQMGGYYAVLGGEMPEGAPLEAAREAGAFVMAVINFLIIAFVVFMLAEIRDALKANA